MVRLIQVKYPDLVELIAPLNCPRELAARELRISLPEKLGLKPEEIGIVYVAPCPAKIVSIKNPAEKSRSYFDGGIAVRDAYAALLPHIKIILEKFDESQIPPDFTFSAGWAALGGITRSVRMENWLAVSGLDYVMKIFDDIENSRLRNVDFIEALPCLMGCIGGSFNVENPYIARTNNIKQRTRYEKRIEIDEKEIDRKLEEGHFFLENKILPRPTKYFDTDLQTSLKRMKEIEKVCQKLPHINCGCCGAPTCKAFAEDFVRGEAELTDCIFLGETSTRIIHPPGEPESDFKDTP
jgi:iron only hydrogenase large subunit-like protein